MQLSLKTKVIIGFFLGLALIGSCGQSKKKSPTTTTTANQVQTTITNPTTTTTLNATTTTTLQPITTTEPSTTTTFKATISTRPVDAVVVVTPTTQRPVVVSAAPRQCFVHGYTKKDGTVVADYYRSCPS